MKKILIFLIIMAMIIFAVNANARGLGDYLATRPYVDTKFSQLNAKDLGLQSQINTAKIEADRNQQRAFSAISAIGALPQVDNAVSVSVGQSNNSTSMAVGYTKSINPRIMFKVNGVSDSYDHSVGAGFSYKFGGLE